MFHVWGYLCRVSTTEIGTTPASKAIEGEERTRASGYERRKMRVKRVVVIGSLATAGGVALLIGRRTGGRFAGRVVGDGYSPSGAARAWSAPGVGASAGGKTDRWHAITVNRSPEEVAPEGQLPGPLAELGDDIEVQIRPAPGDRGTEIHARVCASVPSDAGGVRARVSGEDPRQSLRKALRETQWLLETGEVLKPDTQPTTKPTPGGKLLGLATGRSWEEGRL
jgi:hypothetical protein